MNNTAVILGAGNSTRMKSEKSKLLLEISGKTVIERSVEAFENAEEISRIVVVCRDCDLDEYKCIFKNREISFVIGGKTRQESVKNAVDSIKNADFILIHDGARPLIRKEDISAAMNAAKEFGAAAVGVPLKDTVKVIDKNGIVVNTPDRASLFAVQTPQIFDFKTFKTALEKAEKEGLDFTDDCQVIEYSGGNVKMVTGDYSNIKITTPDDIAVAENLVKRLAGE